MCFNCSFSIELLACSVSEKDDYQIIIQKDSQESVYELPYQDIISSQTATERVWKEADAQLVRNQSDGIFTPVRIIMNNASTFVLDAPDGYIKQADHESETMTRIGQVKGNGPGEFTYPIELIFSVLNGKYTAGEEMLVRISTMAGTHWT